MRITLNGESFDCSATSLQELLTELQLLDKRIAVEFNQQLCPRSGWVTQALQEGDCIEIVHAIGGG
jgi:sulfur carrier protein